VHKTEEEYKEHFDTPEEFKKKIDILSKWVLEAKHFIAFTGAGISTSCGIADFRSGLQTVLDTGAGAWTKRAAAEKGIKDVKEGKTTTTLKAIPSATHMALVELSKQGRLKFIISQNTDGLHRRSGIPIDHLAELHGNSNLEKCNKCGKEYLRDYRCRNTKKVKAHLTGRLCSVPGCEGKLKDTIINFGENLPPKHLQAGENQSKQADLCLAMGSSLRVFPAADLPESVAKRGKRLVVVNLQGTPLDDVAALRINGLCDDVMRALMEKLKLAIPDFILRRYLHVQFSPKGKSKTERSISLNGIDSDGTPVTVFDTVTDITDEKKKITQKKEPFEFLVSDQKTTWEFTFFGHYNEPSLQFSLPVPSSSTQKEDSVINQIYCLDYNPKIGN